MFDVKDSVGFYKLMIENYDDFVENSGSTRHAINCAISAFHIAEWIWGDWLSTDYHTQSKLACRDRNAFMRWIDKQNPIFCAVRDITNGSKHFASKLRGTKATGNYVEEDYVEPGYQEQYLEIDVDGIWIEAIIIVEQLVIFWTAFFSTYRPEAVLARPRHSFTHMPE